MTEIVVKTSRCCLLLAVAALPLAAQAPRVYTDPLGFSYSLPADWEVVIPKTPPPEQRPNTPKDTPEEEKKGIACLQVPLTARHGNPVSTIVIVALPFDCYGQAMGEPDLVAFGSGVTEGLKTTFDFLNPIAASYTLAGHKLWIERVKAVRRGATEPVYTVEIACAILQEGAVCWMVEAADETGLQTFEQGTVTLEGATAERLAPVDVFVKSPAAAKPPK